MLIVCPSCATNYDVEPAVLQRTGRQVRCARCRQVWRVEMSQADKLLAAAAALAPQHGLPEFPHTAPMEEEVAADGQGLAGWTDRPPEFEPEDEPPLEAPAEADADGFGSSPPTSPDVEPEGYDAVEVEAPPIAPMDLDAGRPPIDIDAEHGGAAAGEPEDIETAAARRYPRGIRPRESWSLSRWQVAILGLIIVDAVLVGWRTDFVRILPQTASFYAALGLPVNLRGLSFDEVVTNMEVHEGVPILVVHGNIINDTGGMVDVPRLKFIVRNAARQEIYSWTAVPSQQRLPAYQAESFTTRLASPPPDIHDVLVRFLNRRDFVAGER